MLEAMTLQRHALIESIAKTANANGITIYADPRRRSRRAAAKG